jgi:hypothetical protein
MTSPHPYEVHAFQRISAGLRRLAVETRRDIYAVALLVDYEWGPDEAGEMQSGSHLTLFCNTEEQHRSQIANALDAAEARWNFAFWRHEALTQVPDLAPNADGYVLPDTSEMSLWQEWLRASGDASEEAATVELAVRISQRLHTEGIIQEVFGRPVPVIIHNLEYIHGASPVERANPPGVAQAVLTEWFDVSVG